MDLNHLISNAQQMPTIPKIVQELIASFGDDDVNGDEIASKLSKDQAMTAKVLRMANSTYYGGHRNVGSVKDAVVTLGFNALRTLVLASGLTGAFPPPDKFDIKAFWVKSFTLASMCKWLAKRAGLDPEIAFTCGMVHDIGGLLTHILDNEQALEIDRVVAKGANRIEMEKERLGFDFTEAGAELANRWKFPEDIVDGIRYQLAPNTHDEYKSLAGLIYLATYIYTHKEDDVEDIISGLPTEHINTLGIDRVSLIDNIEELVQMDSGMDDML